MSRRSPILFATSLALALTATVGAASEVEIFRLQTREAMLAGTADGVSIDPLGRLELADRIDQLVTIEEPFLLSAAAHPDGWVVGTGNAGRILRVDRDGTVTTLLEADEPEVFAVLADADGTVWAATSPDGKLYRIPPDGEAEAWFTPGETYVWDLARGPDGGLLVATGTRGKLYRVDGKDRGTLLYDGDEPHLRTLEVTAGGKILLGTVGEGLILELSADGSRVRTLHDGQAPEVVAMAGAPDGVTYAALVASEASLVDLSQGATSSASEGGTESGEEGDGGGEEVTVSVSGGGTSGTRRPGYQGPRSTLVRISPAGVVEEVLSLDEETVFDLVWARDRLWLGTGLEGKLLAYTPPDRDTVLAKQVDDRQLVALMADEPGPAFATTNGAALYRVSGGTERRGTYTSAPLDAEQVARFGSFRWRGDRPPGTELTFAFRSGMSSTPDRTWSPWVAVDGERELTLGEVPRGRYVQWRAELAASDGRSPVLFGAELSYLQENLAPRITELEVLDAGEILVSANFNPTSQVFEPQSPNRDGIFTTLEPASANGDPRLKQLWKKGFRTVRWKVEDPNDDELTYRLELRAEGAEEPGAWIPVATELEDEYLSFDAVTLPDGVYRFRLTASDAPANVPAAARTSSRLTEPVVIDHSPPGLISRERRDGAPGERLEITVEDGLSPLRQAEVSLDAGEWRPLAPTDGLLDGLTETFTVEVPEGTHLLLLRLLDASHNVVTFDLLAPAP